MKINLRDNEHFKIYGTDTLEGPFHRFNEKEIIKVSSVSANVAYLAKNSAGIYALFSTNSTIIKVSVKLDQPPNMVNMSPIGQCGVDLYLFDEKKKEYQMVGVGKPQLNEVFYEDHLITFNESSMRKFILYLPLYSSAQEVFLEFSENAVVKPYCHNNDKRIIFYGTSILQGGCVSRPGLLYSSIITRELGMPILNFGFSGSALLEKEVAEIIAKRPSQKLFIIDVVANARLVLKERLEPFIKEYRKYQKKTPIIITNRIPFAFDKFDKDLKEELLRLDDYMAKVASQQENVYFVDVYRMFKNNVSEITCDTIHLNDYGAYQFAGIMMEIMKKHL